MNIFLNTSERRPRAGWRILLQFVIFIIINALLLAGSSTLLGSTSLTFRFILSALAGTISVWVAARYIDRRPWSHFGFVSREKSGKQLLAGLVMGTAAMSIIFVIEWFFGTITITGWGWNLISNKPYWLWLGSYFVMMIFVGFYEELIFRGYQLRNISEGFQSDTVSVWKATAGAVILSSAIFGGMHAWNPNATMMSTLNIILAGGMLALPYVVTGNLYISIGMHISWNFFQGGVYGFAVSGQAFRGSIVQIRQAGASWLTGGAFGPEAGLFGIVGLLVMLIFFYIFCVKSGYAWSIHSSFSDGNLVSFNADEQSR